MGQRDVRTHEEVHSPPSHTGQCGAERIKVPKPPSFQHLPSITSSHSSSTRFTCLTFQNHEAGEWLQGHNGEMRHTSPSPTVPISHPRGHLGRVCWLAWTAEIKALSAPGWACRGAGGQQPMGFAVSKQSATCIHGTHYPPLRGGPRAGGSEFHGLSYGPRRVGRWGWGRASGPPGWLPGITTTHMRGCGGGGARLPSGPQEPGLGLGVGGPSRMARAASTPSHPQPRPHQRANAEHTPEGTHYLVKGSV